MAPKKIYLSAALLLFFLIGSCSAFQGPAASFQQEPDYAPLKKKIEEFVAQRPNNTYGIYFQDLGSGKSIGINENNPMTAASTIKMPLSLYLSTLAAEKKISWDTRFTYQQFTDYEGGNGVLRYYAREGDRYSVRALNTLSLTVSDNIAFRMLARNLGRENFISFL